jgi:HlyD family secretion protein
MTLPFTMSRRGWTLLAVLMPLLLLFAWVAFRSGPLAPVNVTIAQVEERSISPAMFGIGTVEARYTQKVGPTAAGRVTMVAVDVGDIVQSQGNCWRKSIPSTSTSALMQRLAGLRGQPRWNRPP